ncbi:MAG: hypothetical protein IPL33_07090 [Sphingobacteriales bacterium]|nr:hypothetical protein [Sphingobacteriales bacterium]
MSEKELPHLIEKYRSLSAFEQNILKVLSVIYEPISTNFFFETLRHLKIADSNAVVFMTDVRFRAYKSALVAAGLLTITDRNEFACSEAIVVKWCFAKRKSTILCGFSNLDRPAHTL